ncbi:MAG: hypothetical protein ACTSUR_01995 [Candidatus Heimdallarchaeaceae archaeon]
MIHLISFMDLETGLGRKIYSDDTLKMSEELVWPMVCALNNFVVECTQSERGLVNASLEDIKIFLYSPLGESNPLRFVFFTDLFDNNDYLKMRGQAIFQLLSPYIAYEVFDPPTDIMNEINKIAEYTQRFPSREISQMFLEEIRKKISVLENEDKLYVADLFIGDIDQGKVFTFIENETIQEKNSIQLFSELLTAFSIDNEVIVKSSTSKNEKKRLKQITNDFEELYEGWYLNQLGGRESDFWLVGYFFYRESYEQELKALFQWMCDNLSEKIQKFLVKRPF